MSAYVGKSINTCTTNWTKYGQNLLSWIFVCRKKLWGKDQTPETLFVWAQLLPLIAETKTIHILFTFLRIVISSQTFIKWYSTGIYKNRIQTYQGTVIRQHRAGLNSTITVRRIAKGIGVERIFPMHCSDIASIKKVGC